MDFDLKGLQAAQLGILKELKKICLKNDIKFFLAFGSALGAERHKGFIPWDDDIDVFIHIDDLERLEKACKTQLDPRYFFQSTKTDKEYKLMIYRIRDNNSTLIEAPEKDKDINHGVYIDMYPLYNCASGKFRFYLQWLNSAFYRLLLYGKAPVNNGKLFRIIGEVVLKIIPTRKKEKMMESLYRNISKYKRDRYCSTFYGSVKDSQKVYDLSWFTNYKMVPFEDEVMPVSSENAKYLTLEYGDYMQLPKAENQRIHHNYEFVDLNNSYVKYKGIKYLTKEV